MNFPQEFVNFVPDPNSSASVAEQYAAYENTKFWLSFMNPPGFLIIVLAMVILVSGLYLWRQKIREKASK